MNEVLGQRYLFYNETLNATYASPKIYLDAFYFGPKERQEKAAEGNWNLAPRAYGGAKRLIADGLVIIALA
jgi:hypothetical protein